MDQLRCLFGRFPLGAAVSLWEQCLPFTWRYFQMQKIVAYLLELDPRVKDTIVVWGVVLLIIIDWGSK